MVSSSLFALSWCLNMCWSRPLSEPEMANNMLEWQQSRLQNYANIHRAVLIFRTPELDSLERMTEMRFPQAFKPFGEIPLLPSERPEEVEACPSDINIAMKSLDVHAKSSNWGPMYG